ncbi:MAG: lipoate--protein ligase [Lachnospiraceae bacterium]|nr:lipoate--protein ligase [Lachnospiraceae bacterium]
MIRIYETDCKDPYRNLAAEELFMESDPADIVLFLWQNENTIVIGRNQDAWAECRVQEFLADGGRIARRKSGGGAVYHDTGNLNFSFVAADENYNVRRQLGVIAEAVSAFGIPAEISGRNDLTVSGRKFSGNAFYDNKRMKLHHGTILIDTDPGKIAAYLTPNERKLAKRGVKSVGARVVCLKELCPEVTVDDMKTAVKEAFLSEYSPEGSMQTICLSAERSFFSETGIIERKAEEYADPAWIFGTGRGFDSRMEFGTGDSTFTVHYKEEDGIITDAVVYTDSMDWNAAAKLRRQLIGSPAGKENQWIKGS